MLHTPPEEFVSSRDGTRADDAELFALTFHLLSRWRVFAITCAVSVTLAGILTFLLPKQYTATASILIEPPAGNDPRGSTAVSPVYLESLKTYEHFALSNSLFAQALDRLNLRQKYAGVAIESIKRRVLHVAKPRDTKVLEISATLPDQTKARDLARYIAEQTVEINRSLGKGSIQDLAAGGRVVFEQALKRAQEAKKARDESLAKTPIASLEADVAAATDLRSRLQRDLSETRVELAAYEARADSERKQPSVPADLKSIQDGIYATRAQIGSFENQLSDLDKVVVTKESLLERRKRTQEFLEKELQAAQAQYELASTRNNETIAFAAFRGERLEIIDPGVLPERPSSPNLLLNIALALLASIGGCALYLGISHNYKERWAEISYSGLARK